MRKNHSAKNHSVQAIFAIGACWLLLAAVGQGTNCSAEDQVDAFLEQPGTSQPDSAPSAPAPVAPRPRTRPAGTSQPDSAPSAPKVDAAAGAASAALSSPAPTDLAANEETGAAPWNAMPNMIGDLGGSGGYAGSQGYEIILDPPHPPIHSPTGPSGYTSIPSSLRYKVTDDMNTLPVDRVFFDYQHYNGAVDANGPSDLNHFVFGGEKTFFDGMASLEIRLPVDQALSADQPGAPTTVVSGTEFGNLSLIPKVVLLRRDNWSVSAGLGIVLPTARSSTVGTVTIQNQTVYLQPFIGGQWQSDRWFTMFMAGLDFDTVGNTVKEGAAVDGRFFSQNLMYFDWKVGYWLYKNPAARFLKGIAPTIELHNTSTISDGVAVTTTTGSVGPEIAGIGGWDELDITAGAHFYLRKSILTLYASAPLHNQYDAATGAMSGFFSEIGVQLDRRF